MRTDLLKRFVLTENVSLRRLSNLAMCLYEMKSGKTRLNSLPLKLTIDPSSVCNLRCPLCPTGQRSEKRKRAMMSFSDFKKIIDDVGDFIYEVALYNWGEPFLNKEIYKMIGLLNEKRIKVIMSSNLSLELSEEDIRRIVSSGIDTLIVSMDGTTQESYEKYRIGGKLDTVMKNVKKISDEKNRSGAKKPYLVWQFIVNKFNENELGSLERIKAELGYDALWLGRLRCDMDKEIFLGPEGRYESAKAFLPSSDEYSRYDFDMKKEKSKINSCYFLWTTAAINADGSVSPCCALYDQKYDFGNVFDKGAKFREIWNNESYINARKSVLKMPADKKTICHICAKNGFIQS